MNTTIARLRELGQSVWYDFIDRRLIASGELMGLVERQQLAGMTSNPTIFQKAIAKGKDYDEQIRAAAKAGKKDAEIYEELTIEDIRKACDVFRGLYDRTQGGDGFVSIEVSPRLARDTARSIAEAERLWRRVDRPNLMVKIPGTREGIPAIRACLEEGIPINITLLFSVARYVEVVEAYLSALEARVRSGESVARVASVASFFVSRVDTKVDRALARVIAERPERAEEAKSLLAELGIANAKIAYETLERIFAGRRWEELRERGARRQRIVWGSMSVKNPALPDVYYADALIGPDTIDTMPPETFAAYLDHGTPEVRITQGVAEAHDAVRRLSALGIELDDVTRELETEGIASFSESLDAALATVADRRTSLVSAPESA